MSSGIADYGVTAWLSQLLKITTGPTGYYLACCLDEPGPAMDGDILADLEPDDLAYRRPRIGLGAGYWGLADSYVATIVDVDVALATADWGLMTHYALCSAPTGGDLFAWGEFLNPVFVSAGFFVTIPAGGIVLALSALDSPIAV